MEKFKGVDFEMNGLKKQPKFQSKEKTNDFLNPRLHYDQISIIETLLEEF